MSFSTKSVFVVVLAWVNGAIVAAAGAGAIDWFVGVLFGVALPFFVAMVMVFKEPQQ